MRILSSCAIDGHSAPARLRRRAASPDHPQGAPGFPVSVADTIDTCDRNGNNADISSSHFLLYRLSSSCTMTASPGEHGSRAPECLDIGAEGMGRCDGALCRPLQHDVVFWVEQSDIWHMCIIWAQIYDDLGCCRKEKLFLQSDCYI